MGINMPARTVLFTSARKFDGKNHRFVRTLIAPPPVVTISVVFCFVLFFAFYNQELEPRVPLNQLWPVFSVHFDTACRASLYKVLKRSSLLCHINRHVLFIRAAGRV